MLLSSGGTAAETKQPLSLQEMEKMASETDKIFYDHLSDVKHFWSILVPPISNPQTATLLKLDEAELADYAKSLFATKFRGFSLKDMPRDSNGIPLASTNFRQFASLLIKIELAFGKSEIGYRIEMSISGALSPKDRLSESILAVDAPTCVFYGEMIKESIEQLMDKTSNRLLKLQDRL
jgi:hypothetical protein